MLENTGGNAAVRRSKESNGAQKSLSQRRLSRDDKVKSGEGRESIVDPDSLTLWQHPITTLNYFVRELLIDILNLTKNALQYRKTAWSTVLFVGLFLLLSRIAGPQQIVSFRQFYLTMQRQFSLSWRVRRSRAKITLREISHVKVTYVEITSLRK